MKTALRARLAVVLTPTAGVWAGVSVITAGFTAMFYSWARVAGLLDVAEQMPPVVSGGITGLALVIVGIAITDVAVRAADRQERRHQVAQLDRALEDFRDAIGGP